MPRSSSTSQTRTLSCQKGQVRKKNPRTSIYFLRIPFLKYTTFRSGLSVEDCLGNESDPSPSRLLETIVLLSTSHYGKCQWQSSKRECRLTTIRLTGFLLTSTRNAEGSGEWWPLMKTWRFSETMCRYYTALMKPIQLVSIPCGQHRITFKRYISSSSLGAFYLLYTFFPLYHVCLISILSKLAGSTVLGS